MANIIEETEVVKSNKKDSAEYPTLINNISEILKARDEIIKSIDKLSHFKIDFNL